MHVYLHGHSLRSAGPHSSMSSDCQIGSMASGLLDHDVDFVAVVHFEGQGCVVVLDALAVEDEPALVVRQALALAVSLHQLFELGGPLDLEENLRAVLGLHLDVQLLGCTACSSSSSGRGS